MPLKVSLKPNEKFAINGAVIANGDRRTSLVLQNKANILRERDILQEDEVNTPTKHIYFPIMMMYLDEASFDRYYQEFEIRLSEFVKAVTNPEILTACLDLHKQVINRELYSALKLCRKLMVYEDQVLNA